MKPYSAELVANALKSLSGYDVKLRDVSIPFDGVTTFAAVGTAESKGVILSFAIVGRKPGFNQVPRTYWMPIVPGLDDISTRLGWSNIELATDTGVSYSPSTSNRARAAYLERKEQISRALVKALTEQIGETPISATE